MKTYQSGCVVFPCIVQPKLDGVFAIVRTDGTILSRTGKPLIGAQKYFGYRRLDYPVKGEIYKRGLPLETIAGLAKGENEITEDGLQIHIFDICTGEGQGKRIMKTLPSMKLPNKFTIVESILVDNEKSLMGIYSSFLDDGYEGAVVRSVYNDDIFKLKPTADAEFTCIGVIEGNGKRTGHVGKFVVKDEEGNTYLVGGGRVPYAALRKLFISPPIGKRLTCRFFGYTKYGKPRHMQLIGIRDYE